MRSFTQVGVEFLVIGGLAIAWYCLSRQADDMDLLVNPTIENSRRIFDAMSYMGLTGVAVDSFTKLGVQAPLKDRHWADILTPTKEQGTFESIARDAVEGYLFNMPVRIASRDSLLQLKRDAVERCERETEKHAADIELLQGDAV